MRLRELFKSFFSIKGPDDDVVLPPEQRFRVGEKTIVVKALTFAEIKRVSAELGALLERIATDHPDLDLEHFEQHLTTLVPMLAGALEEFFGTLFEIDPEYLVEHLTPVQAVRIVRALLEVNQLPLLLSEFRRAGELLKTAAIV
ncbi:MAG: hypothetical protein JXA87_03870 [Thermoleophilia bacterium]|nr:hypothetical protein [Thermoleophilia bacterium]